MAEFIALPVGQGDAFYLKRGDLSILVDGGKSALGFSTVFKNVTLTSHADIIVCTHNDADHVNGIIGFLRDGLTCKEIWLPGIWADVLPVALKSFQEVVHEVYDSLDEEGWKTLDEMVEGIDNEQAFPENDLEDESSGDAIVIDSKENHEHWHSGGLEKLLDDASDWSEATHTYNEHIVYFDRILHGGYYCHIQPYIAAAERIKTIALLAYHRGITVRWFEFSATNSPKGGIPKLLPLNSRELLRIRKKKIFSFTHYIALSVSNKRSLVFYSPADEEAPSVLFNADSDLTGATPVSLAPNSLATAPHHGSASNGIVYKIVENWMKSNSSQLTWVRSDGAFSKRPCPAYINTKGNRYCTLCKASPSTPLQPKQAVRFSATSASIWAVASSVRPCTCR